MRAVPTARLLLVSTLLAACARGPGAPARPEPRTGGQPAAPVALPEALPAVPEVRGPLALRVVYPAQGAVITAGDSSFIFGSTGNGTARVTINGTPVRVWPNGAWLAWVPFPRDTLVRFRIDARTATESTTVVHEVRRARDTTALSPIGRVWWPADEYVPLSVRAVEGAEVRMRLPDGTLIPLVARGSRYVGVVRGRAIGPDPGPVLPSVPDSVLLASRSPAAGSVPRPVRPRPTDSARVTAKAGTSTRCVGSPMCTATGSAAPSSAKSVAAADSIWPVVEVIRGADTVRALWPLQLAMLDTLPLAASLDDDTTGEGNTDSLTPGRAMPRGTYHWFFPTGTQSLVTGRVNGDLRLRLSPATEAWISAAEADPIMTGVPFTRAVVGSVSLTSSPDRVTLRVPLSRRVPFQVTEDERLLTLRLYDVTGDVDWIRYGPTDSLVERVTWAQASAGEVTLTAELRAPVWGYRTRWERGHLLLEIRRPPRLDRGNPLRGRLIAVDAGHPPGGATGPTGLREADANLAVARRLRRLLEDAGARVLMTRPTDSAVDLWPRVKLADSAGADLLISIHNNALPDGLNPFTNHGTTVFYNHPRSVPLAREIQHALLQRLKLRDLGIARGDLALVRPTWMPSVLCEGLFMMLPEQEAALRSPEGQELYAQGVYEGVRRFLQEWARHPSR